MAKKIITKLIARRGHSNDVVVAEKSDSYEGENEELQVWEDMCYVRNLEAYHTDAALYVSVEIIDDEKEE